MALSRKTHWTISTCSFKEVDLDSDHLFLLNHCCVCLYVHFMLSIFVLQVCLAAFNCTIRTNEVIWLIWIVYFVYCKTEYLNLKQRFFVIYSATKCWNNLQNVILCYVTFKIKTFYQKSYFTCLKMIKILKLGWKGWKIITIPSELLVSCKKKNKKQKLKTKTNLNLTRLCATGW